MAIKFVVRLSKSEQTELVSLIKNGKKVAAKKRLHAQILLKADEGPVGPAWTDIRISEAFDVHWRTVANIRKRFVEEGLEAALNRKKQVRPSRAAVLDGKAEARLIAMACGSPPKGQVRWTLHLLADQMVKLNIVESVSHETVRQKLKKTN